jgi:hypothetical protein
MTRGRYGTSSLEFIVNCVLNRPLISDSEPSRFTTALINESDSGILSVDAPRPTGGSCLNNRPPQPTVRESPATAAGSGRSADDRGPPSPSTSNDTSSTSSLPPYILYAENSPSRTLVVCFDGTGDQFDTDNSNIV